LSRDSDDKTPPVELLTVGALFVDMLMFASACVVVVVVVWDERKKQESAAVVVCLAEDRNFIFEWRVLVLVQLLLNADTTKLITNPTSNTHKGMKHR
jgi:hypothetical protein